MNPKLLARIGALGGILVVVLQMTGQMLIQVGGQEPAFNASSTEIVDFFGARDQALASWGSFISLLAFIPFLWFLGVLWKRLRQSEQSPGWLSAVTLGSGLLIIAFQAVGGAGWTIAFERMGESWTPELARFQFDLGNYLFGASWAMMASMLLTAGLLSIGQGALPKWTGWFGLVTAIFLLIATAYWFNGSPNLIFFPVMLYWVWLIIVSVVLFRHPDV